MTTHALAAYQIPNTRLPELEAKVAAFARRSRRTETAPGRMMIEAWNVRGHVVVLTLHGNGNGWDIFTACGDNRIDVVLADAELRTARSRDAKGD